jgi:hypothetical protein
MQLQWGWGTPCTLSSVIGLPSTSIEVLAVPDLCCRKLDELPGRTGDTPSTGRMAFSITDMVIVYQDRDQGVESRWG